MRRVVRLFLMCAFACSVVVCVMDGARAQGDVSQSDHDRIVAVISDQIAAFRRDDGPGAFAFAAPGIQALFAHDPERFLAMVRQSYPPVYRPRSTVFGRTEREDGQVVQPVDLQGPDGVVRTALYTMEREADGSWRIAGCVLTEAPDVGA